MEEIEALKKYLEQSNPEVNTKLRNGEDVNDLLFDGLFSIDTTITDTIYRLLPLIYVNETDDGIIVDSAYMSCTKDFDKFIGHVDQNDIAVYRFQPNQVNSLIDPKVFFPDHNDEGEIILPRGLKLQINRKQMFKTDEFDKFLEIVNSDLSSRELIEIYHIKNIAMFDVSIID